MGVLSLVSFVKVCVDVIGKEDGEFLILSLCLFELVKPVSLSLCSNGQIKGLSSSFGLSVNHKKKHLSYHWEVIFDALDSGLADVVMRVLRRENSTLEYFLVFSSKENRRIVRSSCTKLGG